MVYPTPVNETNGSSVSRVVSLARFYECILSLANVRLRHRYAPGNTPQWCVTARGRFRQSRVVVVESLSLSLSRVSFRFVTSHAPVPRMRDPTRRRLTVLSSSMRTLPSTRASRRTFHSFESTPGRRSPRRRSKVCRALCRR